MLLDRLSLTPREGRYRLQVLDPKDVEVADLSAQAQDGVVAGSWTVPEDAAGGGYAFVLRDGQDRFTVERLEFLVRRYQPPRLAKTVELDRETYAPGSLGSAEVRVERVEGGVPAGAEVDAELVLDGERVWSAGGVLDGEGRAVFQFGVPAQVERGEARFVARVTDGGVVESAVETFVVPTGAVEAEFYPEGGELVAGVPTRVYAEVRDPLGRPVHAVGRVVDEQGRTAARFEAWHQGRGRFELTPERGARYRLEIDEPRAEPVPLPAVVDEGVGLRSGADAFPPGAALALEVHVPHEGPWLVGAFCRGVLVGQDTFTGDGAHEVAIELDEKVAGVLRVTVFDAALKPVAERLVHRESGRRVELEIEPEHRVLAPGDNQSIRVAARDEAGRPVSAVVGITVSDRAVRDMVGEARVGLADQTWLVADVEELEEVQEFLGGGDEARLNVDLLLGTRGWRRFAWADAEELIAAHGDDARRLLVREGRPMVPAVVDTRDTHRAELWAARSTERGARERALATGAGALALLVLAAGTWVLWWLLGRWLGPRVAPRLAATAGLYALGFASLVVLYDHLASGARFAGVDMAAADAAPGFAARAAGAPPPGEDPLALGEREFLRELGYLDALGYVDEEGDFFLGHGQLQEVRKEARVDVDRLLRLAGAEVADLEEPEPEADEVGEDDFFLGAGRRQNKKSVRLYVREYAHQHHGGAARVDFTETVYWNASLVTDAEGHARVAFDTSDSVTTWSVAADAHGGGRVGQGEARFEARIPFQLEARLPVEVTRGDELLLPVALASEDPELATASVSASVLGPLALRGEAQEDVPLTGGRGRLLLPVSVEGDGGEAALALVGRAGDWEDRVARPIRVVPRGFPRRLSRSGQVQDGVEFTVAFPEAHAPGSATSVLKLYPSPLAGIQDGVEGLLGMPGGCFEQASRTNYPNVMALRYLDAAGGGDAPALARAPREYLERGYGLLTGYECSERGYEWFGGDPGHEALTAYGLLQFHDMARVFPVEGTMVERTRAWLLGRRDGDGGFERNARALDSFGRAPDEVTDAYVTYALVSTGTAAGELARELDRVQARSLESDDAYEVAVAACALQAAGRLEAADAARDRLKGMRDRSGGLVGSTTSITSSGGTDLAVETTSFAILAWLADPDDEALVQEALEFLLAQRRANGTFGASQATIMAFRALTAHAEANRRIANPGTARLYVNGELAREESFAAGELDPISFDYLEEFLRPGENELRLELSGDNEFPWAFDLRYLSDQPADDPAAAVGITTRLGAERVEEGRTVPLGVLVENLSGEGRPMTLAVIGLPAGLEAPTEVLDDLREAGRFDLWEIDGRELALYWRDLAPGAVHDLSIDCLAVIPGTTTGPASRAYLYYTPERVRWAEPLTVTVTAAR